MSAIPTISTTVTGTLHCMGAIQIFMGILLFVSEGINLIRNRSMSDFHMSLQPTFLYDGFWYGFLCCATGVHNVNCALVFSPPPPNPRTAILNNTVLLLLSAGLLGAHIYTAQNPNLLDAYVAIWFMATKAIYYGFLIPVYATAAVCNYKRIGGPDDAVETELVVVTRQEISGSNFYGQRNPSYLQTDLPSYAVASAMPSPAGSRRTSITTVLPSAPPSDQQIHVDQLQNFIPQQHTLLVYMDEVADFAESANLQRHSRLPPSCRHSTLAGQYRNKNCTFVNALCPTPMSGQPVTTVLSDGTTETLYPDGTIEIQSLITITSQEYTPPISRAPLPTSETDVMTVTRYETPELNRHSEPSTVRQAPSSRPSALYPHLPTYAETGPPSYDIAAAMPSPSNGRRSAASPSAPPPHPLDLSILPPSVAQKSLQ